MAAAAPQTPGTMKKTSRLIMQSGARVAAQSAVSAEPNPRGIRLHFCDGVPGAGLTDVELQGTDGRWNPVTGRDGQATLHAACRPGTAPEVRGVRVTSLGREGPHDPRAKITSLQLILSDGHLLPEQDSLHPLQRLPDQDAIAPSWTCE